MKKFFTPNNILAILIILFSLSGLYVSFILTIEKIALAENANKVLPCTVNAVVNCATVMKSPQASVFGFPNSLLGIAGYSIMLTFGMSLLLTQTKSRIYLLLANFGSLLAFLFSYWLLFQSVYRILALCPYCLVSATSATLIFFSLTFFNIKNEILPKSEKLNWNKNKSLMTSVFWCSVVVWFTIIIALIYLQFGDSMFAGF